MSFSGTARPREGEPSSCAIPQVWAQKGSIFYLPGLSTGTKGPVIRAGRPTPMQGLSLLVCRNGPSGGWKGHACKGVQKRG